MSLESQNVHGVNTAKSPVLPEVATQLATALRASLANVCDRRQIAQLTDRQLADAGIERSAVSANRPTIEVKAGVMAYLMSLR